MSLFQYFLHRCLQTKSIIANLHELFCCSLWFVYTSFQIGMDMKNNQNKECDAHILFIPFKYFPHIIYISILNNTNALCQIYHFKECPVLPCCTEIYIYIYSYRHARPHTHKQPHIKGAKNFMVSFVYRGMNLVLSPFWCMLTNFISRTFCQRSIHFQNT